MMWSLKNKIKNNGVDGGLDLANMKRNRKRKREFCWCQTVTATNSQHEHSNHSAPTILLTTTAQTLYSKCDSQRQRTSSTWLSRVAVISVHQHFRNRSSMFFRTHKKQMRRSCVASAPSEHFFAWHQTRHITNEHIDICLMDMSTCTTDEACSLFWASLVSQQATDMFRSFPFLSGLHVERWIVCIVRLSMAPVVRFRQYRCVIVYGCIEDCFSHIAPMWGSVQLDWWF